MYGDRISLSSAPWVLPLVFFLSLSWRHERSLRGTIQRRTGFPSWSWCGWKAPIGYFSWNKWIPNRGSPSGIPLASIHFSKDIDIKLEKLNGTLLDWASYINLDPTCRQSQLSRFLYITAPTTPIRIKSAMDDAPDITMNERESSFWEFIIRYPDHSKLPSEGLALHLTQWGDRYPEFLIIGLIDGVYERLAIQHGLNDVIYRNYDGMEKTIRTVRLG
jgi:hypothetical protein